MPPFTAKLSVLGLITFCSSLPEVSVGTVALDHTLGKTIWGKMGKQMLKLVMYEKVEAFFMKIKLCERTQELPLKLFLES